MPEKDLIEAVLGGIDDWEVRHSAIIGVDGYIDKIQRAVQSQGISGNEYFPSLAEFGEHTRQAAGKSAQVELETTVVKPGGNAPIMSHALGCLGVKNHCLGTLGDGSPLGVFQSMHEQCALHTLGPPAESNALEFDDGKLILSDLSAFAGIDWEMLKSVIGLNTLRSMTKDAELLALVGWCNPPHATAIWRGFLEEIVKQQETPRPKVFFDLADPSKKSDSQIMDVLQVVSDFAGYSEVTLGLNENEAIKLYQAFGRVNGADTKQEDLEAICSYLIEEMQIHELIVHPIDRCLAVTKEGVITLDGHVVKRPKVSTGGGDNFNAGYCYGHLALRPLHERLLLAMATSGAYVQNGHSPDKAAIKEFLNQMKSSRL